MYCNNYGVIDNVIKTIKKQVIVELTPIIFLIQPLFGASKKLTI